MTACPSQDQLHQMLDDRLNGLALAELEAHVEVCRFCQEHLEALTREFEWKTTLDDVSGETRTENDAFAIASETPMVENDQTADAIGIADFEVTTDDGERVTAGGSTEQVT